MDILEAYSLERPHLVGKGCAGYQNQKRANSYALEKYFWGVCTINYIACNEVMVREKFLLRNIYNIIILGEGVT